MIVYRSTSDGIQTKLTKLGQAINGGLARSMMTVYYKICDCGVCEKSKGFGLKLSHLYEYVCDAHTLRTRAGKTP